MQKSFIDYICREDGATAIEYALLAALIAVALIVGFTNLGSSISEVFNGSESEISQVLQ